MARCLHGKLITRTNIHYVGLRLNKVTRLTNSTNLNFKGPNFRTKLRKICILLYALNCPQATFLSCNWLGVERNVIYIMQRGIRYNRRLIALFLWRVIVNILSVKAKDVFFFLVSNSKPAPNLENLALSSSIFFFFLFPKKSLPRSSCKGPELTWLPKFDSAREQAGMSGAP